MKTTSLQFNLSQSDFYRVLTKRVNTYFTENNINKHANTSMYFTLILILFVYILTYILVIFNVVPNWLMLILASVHGFMLAQIGVNIAHDAMHDSFFKSKKKNKILSLLFNIAGANDYVWRITHNFKHHTYTNVPDHDDDIDQPFVLKVSPDKKTFWIHQFQHIYVFFLYALASISWVFMKDFKKFFDKSLFDEKLKKHSFKEYIRLFTYKIIHVIIYIVIPFVFIDASWQWILLGFLLMHFVEGLSLALIFHLAHLVEGTQFPEPNVEGDLQNSWAVHQMYTTADFSRNNWFANQLCGGLNFQIEHHLFPHICHVHYAAISPIVESTAKEFNLPFIENKTFTSALKSHLRLLKKLGKKQ